MEIRKTEGQRDIEKQDIDIRKVAHTLSGVKRSGRAGMAVTRFSGKALRFGCDQVKKWTTFKRHPCTVKTSVSRAAAPVELLFPPETK